MTKLSIFGNNNQMSCKINIIQPAEFSGFFQGTLSMFSFRSGKGPVTSKNHMEEAKQKCLQEILPCNNSLTPIKYNFHYPINFPHLSLSISHTKNIGIIALANRKDHDSIGIDIEKSDRAINPSTSKFFINSNDDQLNLLDLWTKKEAAFKAESPISPSCKLLKDLSINDNQYFLKASKRHLGKVKTCLFNYEGDEFIISLALSN